MKASLKSTTWRWIEFGFRILAGGLFVFSGFSKLIRPAEFFQMAIDLYDIFPGWLIVILSHTVPWLELLLGSYVMLGFALSASAIGLSFLTFGFQLVLASAVLRNLALDECGCFGGGLHLSLQQSFALDTALLLMLIRISTSNLSPLLSLDSILRPLPNQRG